MIAIRINERKQCDEDDLLPDTNAWTNVCIISEKADSNFRVVKTPRDRIGERKKKKKKTNGTMTMTPRKIE